MNQQRCECHECTQYRASKDQFYRISVTASAPALPCGHNQGTIRDCLTSMPPQWGPKKCIVCGEEVK